MTVRILQGHVLDVLPQLEAESIHCVVTSPPYVGGIRRYGTPPQIWGGDPSCEHVWSAVVSVRQRGQDAGASAKVGNTKKRVSPPVAEFGQECACCGAWRGELGSELLPDCLAWARKEPPCPRCYVCHMRAIFGGRDRPDGIWRVLRNDGTAWLNEGDAFVTHAKGHGGHGTSTLSPVAQARQETRSPSGQEYGAGRAMGLREHNLLMAPARVGLALQSDGWILRHQNVWIKRAPMPESVMGVRWEQHQVRTPGPDHAKWETALAAEMERKGVDRTLASANVRHIRDREKWQVWTLTPCPGCDVCAPHGGLALRWGAWRPTSATEFIYFLTKTDHYYADQDAVRQPMAESSVARLSQDTGRQEPSWRANGGAKTNGAMKAVGGDDAGRNLWNWWAIAPAGGPHADTDEHYATYPTELPKICIQAGTSERGCCPSCGAPWARVIERTPGEAEAASRPKHLQGTKSTLSLSGRGSAEWAERGTHTQTVGWKQTCACPMHEPVPCSVLDTFNGSGTTGVVADRLGRNYVGIELNPSYVQMTKRRVTNDSPLFAQVEVA